MKVNKFNESNEIDDVSGLMEDMFFSDTYNYRHEDSKSTPAGSHRMFFYFSRIELGDFKQINKMLGFLGDINWLSIETSTQSPIRLEIELTKIQHEKIIEKLKLIKNTDKFNV